MEFNDAHVDNSSKKEKEEYREELSKNFCEEKEDSISKKEDLFMETYNGSMGVTKCKWFFENFYSVPPKFSCAMDLGGTLIKIIFMVESHVFDKHKIVDDKNFQIKIGIDEYLCFKIFRIHQLEDALNFLCKYQLVRNRFSLTGGGAFLYFDKIIKTIVHNKVQSFCQLPVREYSFCITKKFYCESSSTLYILMQLCTFESEKEEEEEEEPIHMDEKEINNKKYTSFRIFYSSEPALIIKNKDEKPIVEIEHIFKFTLDAFCKDSVFLVECVRCDEMFCITNAVHKLFEVKNAVFRFDTRMNSTVPLKVSTPLCPFILANIGSGVSIVKSEGVGVFQRVGGTQIGGGTLMGLAQMILGSSITYEQLVQLAQENWDCHQKETTRENVSKNQMWKCKCYSNFSLECSSFQYLEYFLRNQSKINKNQNSQWLLSQCRQKIAQTLVLMVSYNIAQLAYVFSVIHKVKRIFFSGKYVNNNNFIMHCLTWGVYHNHITFTCSQETFQQSDSKKPFIKNQNHGICHKGNSKIDDSCDSDNNNNNNNKMESVTDEDFPEVLFLSHGAYLGGIGCFFS